MNQQQLQAEIMRCTYVKELDTEVKSALIEQQNARREYETYSKKLDPEVKSYFDKVMSSIGDFCHQFNDFMQRASEITDMYLHLDDNLTDEFQRHEIKEAIINREIREKRNNWLEIAETGLRSLELTACAGTAKVMTNAAREMQLARLLAESRAIARNKMPYNAREMEQLIKLNKQGVVSHTLPELAKPNVKLAGLRKERVVGIDPATHKPIMQNVVFDERGFPVFDPYVKVETKITGDLGSVSRKAHMRIATKQLRADIESGKVSKSLFTEQELVQIKSGSEKIGEYNLASPSGSRTNAIGS
jgi:hypothetical protein